MDAECMTSAEQFLELELAAIHSDQHELVAGTIGPLMVFTGKHSDLHERLISNIVHLVNPTIPDVSAQAEDELQQLGIDPQVFRDAFSLAEADVAGVLGW